MLYYVDYVGEKAMEQAKISVNGGVLDEYDE
jgi:hypothetical protein